MKRKLSRALALMLSLVMLLTLLPTAAFAAGEEDPDYTGETAPAEEPVSEEEAALEKETAPAEEPAPEEEPVLEEAAPEEESASEEEAGDVPPVSVRFISEIEELTVAVFDGEQELDPAEDSPLHYLLPVGDYLYTASAEGYKSAEKLPFSVGEEAVEIVVTLEKESDLPFDSRNTEEEEEPVPGEPAPAEEPVPGEPAPAEEPVPGEPAPAEEPVLGEPAPAEEPVPGEPAPAEEPVPGEPAPAEEPVPGEPAPAEEPVPGEPAPAEEPVPGEPAPAEEEAKPIEAEEEPAEAEEIPPVPVSFISEIEELTVEVFDGEQQLEPAEDSPLHYLLPVGDYLYTASAEGYKSAENVPFSVGEEAAEIVVTLEKKSDLPFGLKGMPEGFALSEEQLAAKKRLSAAFGENGIDAVNGNRGIAEYSPDEVIIKADTAEYARTVAEAYNGELVHFSEYGMALIRVGTTGEKSFSSTDALYIACSLDNNFPAVEPNYIVTIYEETASDGLQSVPGTEITAISRDNGTNDPYFPDQWHHAMVQSNLAWNKTKGAGITVAVIDTAIDSMHSDLTNVVIKKMSDVTGYDDYEPLNPHGTHVAGIIGAVRNNGAFGCGVAPRVTIYGYNALPTPKGGGSGYMVTEAFYRAADSGADIINCSFGSYGYSETELDAVNYALNKGATIIAAAGNDNTSAMSYPAAYSGVVSVAAVGYNGTKASYSNYGSWVDLAAPGGDGDDYIWSCAPGEDFMGMQGTSQATPVVSGSAALYMTMYGATSPSAMRTRLKNSCLPTGDSSIGAGIINVPGLLLKITTNPSSRLVKSGTDVVFTAAAKGLGSLSYQWQYRASSSGSWKNSPAAGNKTATLTVATAAGKDGYQYRCMVTDTTAGISRNSSAATLSVLSIATQPSNQLAVAGDSAVFKVKANGSNLKYQWQYRAPSSGSWKNSPATGNKTATLTVPATTSRSGYQYRCRVTAGGLTVTSKAATLTISASAIKPTITTQPANKTVAIGGKVTFKVAATGGNLSYQWQVKKVGSTAWTNCTATGCKTATYRFTAKTSLSGRQYRCVVKNSAGTVNSTAARLTVSSSVAINSTTFPDINFRSYVKQFDTNGNGKFSPSELSAVTSFDLYCMGISSLKGVEYLTSLKYLYCDGNSLTSLDVSKNTKLIHLDCCNNNLTGLDLSKNTALQTVYCYFNSLSSLNLSKNTALRYLDCSGNNLRNLNISKTKVCSDEMSFGYFGQQKGGNVTVKMTSAQSSNFEEFFADDYWNEMVLVSLI